MVLSRLHFLHLSRLSTFVLLDLKKMSTVATGKKTALVGLADFIKFIFDRQQHSVSFILYFKLQMVFFFS